jgi:putative addiction module component (TIGR02574 family)
MATLTKAEIAAMTPEDRLELIDDLWSSFEDDSEFLSTPDWHRQVLEERLAEADRNSRAGVPWEVVKAEMEEKRLP